MQKNYYTFLITQKSKSKIQIRRIEVSKKFLNKTAASLVLTFGIAIFGIVGFFQSNAFNEIQTASLNRQNPTRQTVSFGYKAINYNRPDLELEITNNAGGPLLEIGSEEEEKEIENRLRVIETTSSQEFLPSMWAHLGKINNEFGYRRNPFGGRNYEFHQGLDIDGNKGDFVVAPANGVIIKADWQGGYGNLIEIDHGNGLTTRYGHLSRSEVQAGDLVQRGQLIGLVGSTGRSTGPHLHFEVRLDDRAINPRRFLPPEPPEIRALSQE